MRFSDSSRKSDQHPPPPPKPPQHNINTTLTQRRFVESSKLLTLTHGATLNIAHQHKRTQHKHIHTNAVGSSSYPDCCVSQRPTYKHTDRHSPLRMIGCTQMQQEFVSHTHKCEEIFAAICVSLKVIYKMTNRDQKFHRTIRQNGENGNSGLGSRFTEGSTKFPENESWNQAVPDSRPAEGSTQEAAKSGRHHLAFEPQTIENP